MSYNGAVRPLLPELGLRKWADVCGCRVCCISLEQLLFEEKSLPVEKRQQTGAS